MTLPANIRVNASAPFPATVKGGNAIGVSKSNGIWTVSLNFGGFAKLSAATDPANSYVLIWNAVTGVFQLVTLAAVIASKSTQILTAAGPYAAQPNDEILIVKQIIAAPMMITVDWSTRSKALRVVDGKGDANVNNITITPALGQTQLAAVNYSYVIDGAGGSITLTPLPDGSGAY